MKFTTVLGLGLIVVWGCAILPLVKYFQSPTSWMQVLAFLLGGCISLTMTANFLYTSGLEEKVGAQKREIDNLKEILKKKGDSTSF